MAGSRLEKIGTIFSRATGLLRTGAVKYEDRPIWFDVYRVFPPKLEPFFDRSPVLPEGATEEVPDIIYKEDIPRAAFYKTFGNNPGGVTRNLSNLEQEDLAQSFVEKYYETQAQHQDWTSDQIVEAISQEFSFPRSNTKAFQPRQSLSTSNSQSSGRPENPYRKGTDDVSASPLFPEEEHDEASEFSNRGRRMNIIRADTLLSMFKEAQEKGSNSKGNSDDDKSK